MKPILASELITSLNWKPKKRDFTKGFYTLIWNEASRFDKKSEDIIYETIKNIASIVFGDDMTPYWNMKREQGFLKKVNRVQLFVNPKGEIIGWSGNHVKSFGRVQSLFIDATGVFAEYQANGIIEQMIAGDLQSVFIKKPLHRLVMGMRTENPILYDGIAKRAGIENCYPRITEETPPVRIKKLARYWCREMGQLEKLEEKSLRIINAFNGPCPWRYKEDLTPILDETLMSKNVAVNNFFQKLLNPEDSFLIMAELKFSRLIKFWIKNILKKRTI